MYPQLCFKRFYRERAGEEEGDVERAKPQGDSFPRTGFLSSSTPFRLVTNATP